MAPLTATGGTPMPGKTPAPQSTRPSIGEPPPGKAPASEDALGDLIQGADAAATQPPPY